MTSPASSKTVGLADFEAAIVDLASGTSDQMKVLVDPNLDNPIRQVRFSFLSDSGVS